MYFVYGYHDADHFSPHLWQKSIGDTLENYDHVRACLRGCAARGKCRARFCPRHPSGGYKCAECKRLDVVPVRGSPSKRYFTIQHPQRSGVVHRVTRTESSDHYIDAYGHIHHHHHTNTHHDRDHFPRFQQTETESEAETESGSEYVRVVKQSPYYSSVDVSPSNIKQYAPRVVKRQTVQPRIGADHARNGPVDAYIPQDPLAKKIDCNFMDCTGMQSEPFVPAGSLNPVIPYVNNPETRTTMFSTVPDMLEPRTEQKVVYVV
jgi:hypothetical protein